MKGAYKVLSSRQIDARLSTNGRINLRQQSCRHWNEGNASQVHCRSEPSQITNHAAAKGYNCIASFKFALAQEANGILKRLKRLVLLAFFHQPIADRPSFRA